MYFHLRRKPRVLRGTGYFTLLKWIVMYAWQTLIMRLVSARFKEEMLEMREELIRSHIFMRLHSFSTWFPGNFCLPAFGNELSYGSRALFIRSSSAVSEPSLKRTPLCLRAAAAANKVAVGEGKKRRFNPGEWIKISHTFILKRGFIVFQLHWFWVAQ